MAKPLFYDSARRGTPPVEEIRGAFEYRHLILQLVRRDVLTRYKRSVLGIAWTLLNPLGMMVVLTLAFSQIFRFMRYYKLPGLCVERLIILDLFLAGNHGSHGQSGMGRRPLNRIYIPRSSFALAAIGTGIVNMALATIPLLFVMVITKVPINISLVFLPVPVLLLAGFALGMGLLISALAVYFPDVVEMYQIVLTAWFYLTPIIYPERRHPRSIPHLDHDTQSHVSSGQAISHACLLRPIPYLARVEHMHSYIGYHARHRLVDILEQI